LRRQPYILEQYPAGVNSFGNLLAFHYVFLYPRGDILTRILFWSLKHVRRSLDSKSISWREPLKEDLPMGFRDNPGLKA